MRHSATKSIAFALYLFFILIDNNFAVQSVQLLISLKKHKIYCSNLEFHLSVFT